MIYAASSKKLSKCAEKLLFYVVSSKLNKKYQMYSAAGAEQIRYDHKGTQTTPT